MFFPGAAVYMEKVATGPEAADVIDVTAPPEENVRQVAKAKGMKVEEITVTILDRRTARGDDRRGPRGRRAGLPHHRRRRGGGDRRGGARAPASTSCSGSAARPRASSPRRRSSAWAARSRDASAPRNDEERDQLVGRGPRPRTGPDDRRPRLRQGRVLRGDGRDGRLAAARREVLARRRHDVFHGDALAIGNGSIRRGAAPLRETRADSPASTTAGRAASAIGNRSAFLDILRPRTTRSRGDGREERSSSAMSAASQRPRPSRSRWREATTRRISARRT